VCACVESQDSFCLYHLLSLSPVQFKMINDEDGVVDRQLSRLPLDQLSPENKRLAIIVYRMILGEWALSSSTCDNENNQNANQPLFERLCEHLKIQQNDKRDIIELMDSQPEQASGEQLCFCCFVV
jgi:hypothetical protein